jgi:hypothetical protein
MPVEFVKSTDTHFVFRHEDHELKIEKVKNEKVAFQGFYQTRNSDFIVLRSRAKEGNASHNIYGYVLDIQTMQEKCFAHFEVAGYSNEAFILGHREIGENSKDVRFRRLGIGTEMMDRIERSVAAGKDTVLFGYVEGIPTQDDTKAFLLNRGYGEVIVDYRRELGSAGVRSALAIGLKATPPESNIGRFHRFPKSPDWKSWHTEEIKI